MRTTFIAIVLMVLAPGIGLSDTISYSGHDGSPSDIGRSAWFLLDDDRGTTTYPFPWGISASCNGRGRYEFSIALHGVVSTRPRYVDVTYRIGDGERVVTRSVAFDSTLTGFPDSSMTEIINAVASGQRIQLSVATASATWFSTFDEYQPDPDKVIFVLNGCR